MGYTITKQGDTVETYVYEVVVDTRAECSSLPTAWKSGSTAFCIEDSSVWILGINPKQWHEV